jgi:hypothetical protein
MKNEKLITNRETYPKYQSIKSNYQKQRFTYQKHIKASLFKMMPHIEELMENPTIDESVKKDIIEWQKSLESFYCDIEKRVLQDPWKIK